MILTTFSLYEIKSIIKIEFYLDGIQYTYSKMYVEIKNGT